jgi:hypothetical protein
LTVILLFYASHCSCKRHMPLHPAFFHWDWGGVSLTFCLVWPWAILPIPSFPRDYRCELPVPDPLLHFFFLQYWSFNSVLEFGLGALHMLGRCFIA